METLIREVTRADVPAVVALVERTLAEFGLTFGHGSATDDQLARLPSSYEDAGGRFYVAEREERLLGTAGVYPLGGDVFELRKMYLEPAARGAGVGHALFERCLAHARAQGARRLVLDTTHQMTAAIRFYERLGFHRDDDQVRGARCSRGYRLDLER